MELLSSIVSIFTTNVFLYLLLGVAVGMVIGALPGLSAVMAVAILTPLTFWLEPAQGLAVLLGVYNSAIWAGGISAILINTPGTPASIAQSMDGYAMVRRGDVMLPLSINTIYSCLGGMFGAVVLTIAAFPIARFALKFSAPEMFALALFGLSMMISVSGENIVKGLFSGLLGLMISCIGLDPMFGSPRYTFGNTNLLDGVQFVVIMVGMFGLGEVLYQISNNIAEKKVTDTTKRGKGRFLPNKKEVKESALPVLLGSIFSVFVGAVPGTGGDIASVICWNQCKSLSKHPEEYGNGSFTGLAVTSASNNACIGGAMTTMMALGVPGDSVTAVLIGSLMMYGMQPGPTMFTERMDFVYVMMGLMIVAYLVILVLGLFASRGCAVILKIKDEYIWMAVIGFTFLGSFAVNNSIFDVGVMLAAGLVGYLFKKVNIPMGPFILALLLGNIAESNFRRALAISMGDLGIFFRSPIAMVLLVGTIASLCFPAIAGYRKRKKQQAAE